MEEPVESKTVTAAEQLPSSRNGYAVQVIERTELNDKGEIVIAQMTISAHDDVIQNLDFGHCAEVRKYHKEGYNCMTVTMYAKGHFVCWPELMDFLLNNEAKLMLSNPLFDRGTYKTMEERWFIPKLKWTKQSRLQMKSS